MSQKPCAWRVGDDKVVEKLPEATPDYENNLETWIEQDPSIADSDVLLIGRQVQTDFGTVIDLLGLDSAGNTVIIELKRDQTLRETVAQALEYAAWVARLGYDEVVECATERYFHAEQGLQDAFRQRFDQDLPETLNQVQRILVVAPSISDCTHAVIEYLSETYGVPINAVSFGFFHVDGKSVLVRQLALPETPVQRVPSQKTRGFPTIEQVLERAEANGVGQIVLTLMSLQSLFRRPWRAGDCWQFGGRARGEKQRYLPAMTVFPTAATKEGAVVIGMKPENLSALYAKSIEECRAFVQRMQNEVGTPEPKVSAAWERFALTTNQQAEAFVREFTQFAGSVASKDE